MKHTKQLFMLSFSAVFGLIVFGFTAAPSAQAATRYWDTTAGAGNGVGGTGSWSSSSTTWSTTSTGDATLVTAATTDDLIFQGTGGAIQLASGTNTAKSLTFNTINYAVYGDDKRIQGPISLADGINLRITIGTSGKYIGLDGSTTSGGAGSSIQLDNNGKGVLTFDLRNSSSLGASTPINITSSGAATSTTIANTAGGVTINSPITNNSSLPLILSSGASGAGSAAIYLYGKISGTQGVVFNVMPAGAVGRVDLYGVNDYAGDTYFSGVAGIAKSNSAGLVKLNTNNAISTVSNIIMGYSSGRGENLDLNGKQQTFASLTSNAGGTGSIYNTAVGTSTITINGTATAGTFGLEITDGADSTRKVALTRAGTGTTTLTGTNTYTGATSVTGGKLLVSGSIDSSAVTVSNNGTVLASGSTGTLGSSFTINSGAILAAGDVNAVGKATVGNGASSLASGSIFSWDLASNKDTDSGTRGTDYDALDVTTGGTLAVDSGAIFRVVLGSGVVAGSFWQSTQSWSNIFSGTLSGNFSNSLLQVVDSAGANYDQNSLNPGSGYGFTISGSELTWSAVPEPTSALAGILLTAGLLRRRRN